MFVSCVCCAGSGLCDELITHAEDSYCVSVWGSNFVLSIRGADKSLARSTPRCILFDG